MAAIITATIGYPRIGVKREMKKALETYWGGKCSLPDLISASDAVFTTSMQDQKDANIDIIEVGEHTMYDNILDWILRFGLIPNRFSELKKKGIVSAKEDLYFAMARGKAEITALDMTKWFDSNYHNITPELNKETFKNGINGCDFSDYLTLIKKGIQIAGNNRVAASIIGPLTFAAKSMLEGITVLEVIEYLTPLYVQLLKELAALNVAEVHLHEPALVLEAYQGAAYHKSLQSFISAAQSIGSPIHIITYYDDLGEAFEWVTKLEGIAGVGMDFTRGNNMKLLQKYGFPEGKRLGAGVLDGRSVWGDVQHGIKAVKEITNVWNGSISIQPSCSLMHLPVDVEVETKISSEIRGKLRFARQKLQDLTAVKQSVTGQQNGDATNGVVEAAEKEPELESSMFNRGMDVESRRKLQLTSLDGVKFVTSTIGSFPQTTEMRKIRLKFRKGEVSQEEYNRAVDEYIAYCIGVQDGIGLDILVHGEPERSDMVEYFAEKMDGFIFTENGWVQSYGSRYIRPPIIYNDVKRKGDKAMTVREYQVASRCTPKLVKGMLTGPVTILNWSFPRKDVSRMTQSYQIALALRDEVKDLEDAGCSVIQMDEPALREGLPLKSVNYEEYLKWAVDSFRLSTAVVKPETHIVTHFCYSEFGDVMPAIKRMDADQITIENSRSNNAMLTELVLNGFKNVLAPGVYDVHSPVVPQVQVLQDRIENFLKSGINVDKMFIVPDCGLKTRKWEEVIASLRNVVEAVCHIREKLQN